MGTVLSQRIEQLQDEITPHIEDWDVGLDMIASGEAKGTKEAYCDFLEKLAVRVKKMDRRLNWVEYKQGAPEEGGLYIINNYSYDTYLWALKRGVGDVMTSYQIIIHQDELTPEERGHLRGRCEK